MHYRAESRDHALNHGAGGDKPLAIRPSATITFLGLLGVGLGLILTFKDLKLGREAHLEKYARRKPKEGIDPEILQRGADCIYEAFDSLKEGDELLTPHDIEKHDVKPFLNLKNPGWNDGSCGIQGVWIVGSTAAKRYTRGSDIDYWLKVTCLTEFGREHLDDAIVDAVGNIRCNAGNKKIDVFVSNKAPPKWMEQMEWTGY